MSTIYVTGKDLYFNSTSKGEVRYNIVLSSIPQEEDGVYRCVCSEGLTGENCQTPDISSATPRQQSEEEEEEESGMSAAIIAAIVTGVLVALLLCAVVVTVIIVCIWLRKRSTKRESNSCIF